MLPSPLSGSSVTLLIFETEGFGAGRWVEELNRFSVLEGGTALAFFAAGAGAAVVFRAMFAGPIFRLGADERGGAGISDDGPFRPA